MVFSKAEGMGEKGTAWQSRAPHTRASQGPFLLSEISTHSFKDLSLLYVHEGVGFAHVCRGVQGGQERASDPLKPESQVVGGLLAGAQGKNSQRPQPPNCLCGPCLHILVGKMDRSSKLGEGK